MPTPVLKLTAQARILITALAFTLLAPLSSVAASGNPSGATAAASSANSNPSPRASCPAILKHRFPRLQDEAPQDLCQYSGKVALVVNTASYCGFTGQYEGLEKLYARYRDRGLVVLGFPSNDFAQEPGNSKQIADLCYNTYGVKFPMFSKSPVRGKDANPFYQALIRESGGQAPKWNFHKYLISRDGRVLANYSSLTGPEDKTLVSAIEKALAAPAVQ